jgi:hypothetical protein
MLKTRDKIDSRPEKLRAAGAKIRTTEAKIIAGCPVITLSGEKIKILAC